MHKFIIIWNISGATNG